MLTSHHLKQPPPISNNPLPSDQAAPRQHRAAPLASLFFISLEKSVFLEKNRWFSFPSTERLPKRNGWDGARQQPGGFPSWASGGRCRSWWVSSTLCVCVCPSVPKPVSRRPWSRAARARLTVTPGKPQEVPLAVP